MKKFFNWLDNTFIKPVEESKMPLGVFVLIAVGYIAVRNLMEGAFESLHLLGLAPITLGSIEELFLHLNFSWLFLFMAVIVLMHFTTGHDIRKIARVLLIYSFIIILAPIVDPIFRAGGYKLAYPNDPAIVINAVKAGFQPWLIFRPWQGGVVPYGSSPGMLIEGYIALLLIAVYSGLKARTRGRKIAAILLAPLVVIVAVTLAGGGQVFATLLPGTPSPGQTVYFTGGLITSATRKYALVLLFPFTAVLWLGLFLYNKVKTRLLIRSLDPFVLVISALAAVAGFLFAWLGLRDLLVGVPRNPFDYIALIALLVLGAMAAAVHLFIGYSHDSSRSEADRKTFRRAAGGMFVMATAFVWCLGYPALFIYVSFLAVTLVMTLPPLRLQRYLIPSVLLNALATFLLVLCGYSLFATERTVIVFPWQLALALFVSFAVVFLGREIIMRRAKKSPKEAEL